MPSTVSLARSPSPGLGTLSSENKPETVADRVNNRIVTKLSFDGRKQDLARQVEHLAEREREFTRETWRTSFARR